MHIEFCQELIQATLFLPSKGECYVHFHFFRRILQGHLRGIARNKRVGDDTRGFPRHDQWETDRKAKRRGASRIKEGIG